MKEFFLRVKIVRKVFLQGLKHPQDALFHKFSNFHQDLNLHPISI